MTPRVQEHLEALRKAGLDTQAFFEALVALREDSALTKAHREVLRRTIAMECLAWYLEALAGEPIDRVKAMAVAQQLAQSTPAAQRTSPSEKLFHLLQADLRLHTNSA